MVKPNGLACRMFHMPKAGNAPDEYEDAFAGDPEQGRFAIADGASESSFAGAWAKILVNAFVKNPGPWSKWLTNSRKRWCDEVQQRELPWYEEIKFEEGAYGALLAVTIGDARWRATAVGDCCLFHVRDQRLLRAFPMRYSREFGNRPSLLGSRRRKAAQPRTRRFHCRGGISAGDFVFMMTDALAQWFLTETEVGQAPWMDLQAIVGDEQFFVFIDKLRQSRDLRNDDVTLALIEARSP